MDEYIKECRRKSKQKKRREHYSEHFIVFNLLAGAVIGLVVFLLVNLAFITGNHKIGFELSIWLFLIATPMSAGILNIVYDKKRRKLF